jgi:hypothetical protein
MFAYSCWTQDPEQLHEYEFLRNSMQLLDRLLQVFIITLLEISVNCLCVS